MQEIVPAKNGEVLWGRNRAGLLCDITCTQQTDSEQGGKHRSKWYDTPEHNTVIDRTTLRKKKMLTCGSCAVALCSRSRAEISSIPRQSDALCRDFGGTLWTVTRLRRRKWFGKPKDMRYTRSQSAEKSSTFPVATFKGKRGAQSASHIDRES